MPILPPPFISITFVFCPFINLVTYIEVIILLNVSGSLLHSLAISFSHIHFSSHLSLTSRTSFLLQSSMHIRQAIFPFKSPLFPSFPSFSLFSPRFPILSFRLSYLFTLSFSPTYSHLFSHSPTIATSLPTKLSFCSPFFPLSPLSFPFLLPLPGLVSSAFPTPSLPHLPVSFPASLSPPSRLSIPRHTISLPSNCLPPVTAFRRPVPPVSPPSALITSSAKFEPS